MMDNFDKKIKNKIDNEIGDIPESLDKKIEGLLNSKKKNNKWNRTVAIAAIGFAVFLGSGMTLTSYATGKDFKDIIYSFLNFNDNYNKYSTGLNEAQSSEGIKVTVTSVVFDGYKVNIAYKIEADKDKQHILRDRSFNLQTNDLGETKIKINNKRISTSSGEFWNFDEDGNQIGVISYDIDEGVTFIDISEKFSGKNSENFNIEININKNIDGKDAKWNFNIPISNEKLTDNIKEYKVNKKEDGVNLESIIVTPLSIYVKGSLDKKCEELRVLLEDKKGNEYSYKSANMSSVSGKYKFRFEFDNNIKNLSDVKAKIFYNKKELKNLENNLNMQ